MAIDTSVQLNNHNSYRATEDYWHTLWGVETQKYMTVSVALFTTLFTGGVDVFKLRFYSDSGEILNESTHAFDVTPVWDRVSATVQVPEDAKYSQICFLAGDYWWAEPKAEGGEVATAYAVNTSGQLTWMTANGIYTGTITASQVVLTSGDPLDTTLATFNSNILSLSNRLGSAEADLTEITAGSASFIKASDLKTAGKTEINGGNITTGYISAARIAANSITANKLNVTNLSAISANLGAVTAGSINIGSGKFKVTSAGALSATGASISGELTATSGTIGGFTISSGVLTSSSTNGYLRLSGSSGYNLIQAGTSASDIRFRVGTDGSVSATSMTITGSTVSGSTLGGTLNSANGSVSNITGSFNGTTGTFNGSHYGYLNSVNGYLGGVPYSSSDGLNLTGDLKCVSLFYKYLIQVSSDRYYKENITQVNSRLISDIYDMGIKEYDLKQDGERYVGIIANDVIERQPGLAKYVVVPNSEGRLSVNYTNLNTISIAAIQDLNERLKKLEEKTA